MAEIQNEWKQRAQKEINEPLDLQIPINQLRELIKKDITLNSRLDDGFMIKFLRARKYNTSKAFYLLQRYYKARQKDPTLYNLNVGPSTKNLFLETGAVFMLPDRDQHGRRIFVFRINKALPDISMDDVFKINYMTFELISEEPETQIAGVVIIADLTGFEWHKHHKYLSPYYAKKGAEIVQENFPLRFQGFHFINEPLYIYTVYSIIKPFLKEKIRCRVHFHGNNLSSLHKYINRNILPDYYGGAICFDPASWIHHFLSKDHYFEEIQKYGYNTSVKE
ncbi:clavesin-2-like [Adelges cooleyi]|uniref:clavesin-2-like n=1 Tax=Adelges cooleyi TaxID=133065 RepID=UPI00217FFA86|nr:clavesin-2-like [Adelges cooleyi]